MHRNRYATAQAYALSFAALLGAYALRWATDPWLGDSYPFTLTYAAVAIAVWAGGYVPAVVIALVGFVIHHLTFVEPRGHFGFTRVEDVVGLIPFWITTLSVILLGEAMRAARKRAEQNWRVASAEAQQRQQMELALRESKDALAAELEAVNRLHGVSTRLLAAIDVDAGLEDVLENAVASCNAQFGTIERFDAEHERVRVVAERGFTNEFTSYLTSVRGRGDFACAETLRAGAAAAVSDTERDPRFERHREVARAAGFRAMYSVPLKTDTGAIVGIMSVYFRDPMVVSEWNARLLDLYARHTADFLQRRGFEDALAEADRRKSEFLATLSHELRNCIAPVRFASQILDRYGANEARRSEALAVMDRQTAQMTRLVDDLLDSSRLAYKTLELRKARVPLDEIIDNAIETSRPVVERYQHVLHVESPSLPIYVDADAQRLVQAISNVLNNASKYTPPGGRIVLSTEARDGEVFIKIRDNGIGIAPELLPKLFDMFLQAERSTERTGGLGLGLPLVKGLVELHGGEVRVHSDGPGKGSEFTIGLPMSPMAHSPANASIDGAAQGAS